MRHTTQVPRRVNHRFSIAAICGFVMFSATFAVATAFQPRTEPVVGEAPILDPIAQQAESAHSEMLNERLHLHLKRLSM